MLRQEVVVTLAPKSPSTLFSILDISLELVTDTDGATMLNLTTYPAVTDLTIEGQNFEEGIQNMFPGAAKSSGAF